MFRPSLSYIIVVILFLLSTRECFAELFPGENAKLNYRIIGFSFPLVQEISDYRIQIAAGKITKAEDFNPQVVSAVTHNNHVITEVPAFGTEYTWRVAYIAGEEITYSELHHFSTGKLPAVDTEVTRLRVTQKTSDQFYILSEAAGAIYDANGAPVWYVPDMGGPALTACDLKCTPQHTLTFIYGRDGIEMNYNGKIVWKSPPIYPETKNLPSETSVTFHHEFNRLANGHYMGLGSEPLRAPGSTPGNGAGGKGGNEKRRHRFFPRFVTSVLYEFDEKGNLVWSWNSADYFAVSDISSLYWDMSALPRPVNIASHENAFCFDEREQAIYLSYAAFNRIVKISYPSGKVIKTYGKIYNLKSGRDTLIALQNQPIRDVLRNHLFNNGLFSGQHNSHLMKDGSLIMYNNNMFDTTARPEIVILKQTANGAALEKAWTYRCPIDDMPRVSENEGGGSVYEMAGGALFVSMNYPYSKLFVVNRKKELLWTAYPERKMNETWVPLHSYRTSIIFRQELEQLIWNGERQDTENDNPFAKKPLILFSY